MLLAEFVADRLRITQLVRSCSAAYSAQCGASIRRVPLSQQGAAGGRRQPVLGLQPAGRLCNIFRRLIKLYFYHEVFCSGSKRITPGTPHRG